MDKDSSNGLGKLLPKSITAKRRRKRTEGAPSHDDDADDDRGRSPALKSRETLESDTTASSTSMVADDEQSRSLHSYDSDEPSRPGVVSAHPSQIGYLTTSSPIVQATHISESLTDLDSNSSGRSSTFPAQRSDSLESKESSRLGRTKTGLRPPHDPSRRSASPGAKFKGIFRPKKSSVESTTPERRRSSHSIEHPPPPGSGSSGQPTTSIPDPDPDPPVVSTIIEPAAAAKIASPDRRSRVQPKIDTSLPPRTPPSGDKPAPVIVNTPPTPVDTTYGSAQSSPDRKSFRGVPSPYANANGDPPSRAMSGHRRSRSGSVNIGPSKLSNIVAPPLSPALESGEPTPSANAGSGFFSSMMTVAQNAASTLSNNIQNTSINLGANKKVNGPPKLSDIDTSREPEVKVESTPATEATEKMDQRGSAVRTLGAGELSLSQLGLAETSSTVASPMSPRFPDVSDTRARSESAPADNGVSPVDLLPEESFSRPRSLAEPPSRERSPPPPEYTEKSAVQRTSSLRSALKQPHRKRGSSVTTGTTIGAAIAAANTLAHPNLSAPKLTGFAIASKKRNRDFHDFFKSVPDDDYLIEDYSCALQREILAHGRLYVSEGHLCFSSNILGWTTTLVMSFDEIVSVEKRSTALVFKNGLMISTLHAKHVFASFTSRDGTYDLIVNIWKLGHPTLKSTLNGVCLEGTGGDKTEKVDADAGGAEDEGSETEDDSDEDEEEYYDEDIHDEIHGNLAEANGTEADVDSALPRKASGVTPANGAVTGETAATSGGTGDFPGPSAHLPTECGDVSTHYDRIVGDDIIPAPLGKVYSLIFGQASPKFMSNWLTGDQKCTELQDDIKGLNLENRSRTFSYIKPLNGSIGPRQTKCIVTETLDILDYERAANLSVSTQTPDVPSGNVFCVKTRYCLSWAENNATRVQTNCTIEWSGKSWLKGPIEKGANDGQITYCKDLFTALKAEVSTRQALPSALVTGGKGKRKGKSKKSAQLAPGVVEVAPKRVEKPTWGMLEPVRGLLEPLGDILKPLLTGNMMYGLLVGLLVTTWFKVGITPSKNAASFGQEMGIYRPQRLAAYEEMWRREDSELWDWLDERVGMDRLNSDRVNDGQRAVEPRTVEEKLRMARMDEREVEEAIRITEEKLKILKGVTGKKPKPKPKPGSEASKEIPQEGR